MKVNDKVFKGILSLLGFMILVGYGVVYFLKLEEPVFMEHTYYLELDAEEDSIDVPFNLSYITNDADDRVAIGAMFPEYPDLFIQASEHYSSRRNSYQWDQPFNQGIGITYGHYSVRTIYLQMQGVTDIEEINDHPLTEITIFFSDSSEMTVDIGEIHLTTKEEDSQLAEMISSSSSANQMLDVMYRIHEDMSLSLSGHENSDLRSVTEEIRINEFNHTDSEELEIMEGESLNLMLKPRQSGNILNDYTLRNFISEITYTTAEGTDKIARLPLSIYHTPEYNFRGIYSYLRARGEL